MSETNMTSDALERENKALRQIVKDTIWMARRYADERSSYAVGMFNDAVHALDSIGLGELLSADTDGNRFANDGMFGTYDPVRRTYSND